MAERPKYRPIWGLAASLIVMVLVTGAYVSVGSQNGHAQVATFPCYAAPADYVAAFDGQDGTVDGAVSYPEPRAYYESQGHLPTNVTIHHREHIHIATCFPYAEDWKQPNNARTLDLAYTFFQVENYNITRAFANFVSVGNSGKGFLATPAQVAELEAAMDASATGATKVFQHQTMTGTLQLNCRTTGKMGLTVVRANPDAVVDSWEPEMQITTNINYAGQGACTPEFTADQMRGRDWPIPAEGYIYSTFLGMPRAGLADVPVSDPWSVTINAVNQNSLLMIDPDLHNHDPDSPDGDDLGLWNQDYGVFFGSQTVSIPTADLPAGNHRLMFYGQRGIHAAIMVVPFTVASAVDTQAPSTPTGLTKSNVQPSSVQLSWNASTDNVGVAGYRVYRSSVLVATVTGTTATVSNLSQAQHLLQVEAFDAAGNVSPRGSLTITRTWL